MGIKIAQLTQGRAETREKSEMCFVPLGIFLILTSGLLWHFNYAQPTFLKEREKRKSLQKIFFEIFLSVYPAGITSDWERLLPRFNIIPLSTIPSLSSVSAPPSLITPLAHPPYSLSLWISPHPLPSLSLSLLERTSGDNTLALSVFCCCRTDRKASRLHPLLPCQTGNSDQGKTSENTMCSVRAGLSCQC